MTSTPAGLLYHPAIVRSLCTEDLDTPTATAIPLSDKPSSRRLRTRLAKTDDSFNGKRLVSTPASRNVLITVILSKPCSRASDAQLLPSS